MDGTELDELRSEPSRVIVEVHDFKFLLEVF